MKKKQIFNLAISIMGFLALVALVLILPSEVAAKTKMVTTSNGTKLVCESYNGKTYQITGIKNAKEELIIPETVDGKHKITTFSMALQPCYGYSYKKVRRIYFPATVKNICEDCNDEDGFDYNAFSAFPNLTEIFFDTNNQYYSAADGKVYDTKKRLVAIAPGRSEVTIDSWVTSILPNALSDFTKLEQFTVEEENAKYKSVDGVLYTKDGETLLLYPLAKKDKEFRVPEGVKTIESAACFGQKHLTRVVMSSTVQKIKDYAFAWCPLKKVKLNKNLKVIEEGAFRNTKWCSISLPSGLKKAEIGSLPVKKLVIPAGCKVTLDVDHHSSQTWLRAKTLVVKDKSLNLLKLDKEYQETLWDNEFFDEDDKAKSVYAKKTIYAYEDSKTYKQIGKIAKKYHIELKKLKG